MSSARARNHSSSSADVAGLRLRALRGLFIAALLTAVNVQSQAAAAGEPTESKTPRSFAGILVDRAGFPVSRAMVAVAGENIWRGSHTDDQGRFRLSDLPPAAKTVLAYSQRATRMAVIPIRTDASPDTHYVLDRDICTVIGRVVDEERRAVDGAKVTLRITGPNGVSFTQRDGLQTFAGGWLLAGPLPAESGWTIRASLKTGESAPAVQIVSRATTVLPDLVQHAPAKASAKMLAPLAVYSGRIVDEQGRAINDVLLTVTDHSTGIKWEAISDATGRWSLSLPADFDHLDFRLDHPDFSGWPFDFRQSSPPTHALRDGSALQVMKRGLSLRGIVRDPSGTPIGNALVLAGQSYDETPGPDEEAIENSSATRTQADGTFSVGGIPAGRRSIAIYADGSAPAVAWITVSSQMKPLDIKLDKGWSVQGRIVDESGRPVSNATIGTGSWQVPNAFPRQVTRVARSDANGRFLIRALPTEGSIVGSVSAPGRLYVGFTIAPGLADVGDVPLYSYPVIEGKVVDDQSGQPITKFAVTMGWLLSGKFSALSRAEPLEAKDGSFRREVKYVMLQGGVPTQFLAKISAAGYSIATTPPLAPGKKPAPFLVKLKKATVVHGTVLTAAHKPAARAELFFLGPENDALVRGTTLFDVLRFTPEVRTAAGADGKFELAWPGANGRLLVLHEAGYAVLSAGEMSVGQTVILTPWARLEGVYAPDGRPRNNARISADAFRPKLDPLSRERLQFDLSTTTDAAGRFVIEHVPALELRVSAFTNLGTVAGKIIRVEPGKAVHVTLADDGPGVNGQVELGPVIAANPPLPGTKFDTSTSWVRAVRIEPKPEPPRGVDRTDWNAQIQSVLEGTAKEDLTLPTTFAVLKPDGSFRFDALAPGRYMLLVDVHGLRPLQTCGWGILLATGRAEFTVADKAITLSPLELKATFHPQVGSIAPQLAWSTAEGESISLAALHGKYVALDFWAGWCAPCVASQPLLKAVAGKYKGRVTVVGLNFDYTTDKAKEAIEVIKTPWRQVWAGAWDAHNTTLVAYGTEVIPSIWLIDPEGRIAAKDLTPEALDKELAHRIGR
jgi:thiol-disulfide isomerase/thioredoxin